MHRYPTRCGEEGWSGRPPRNLLLSGEPKNERGEAGWGAVEGQTGVPAEGTARAKAVRPNPPGTGCWERASGRTGGWRGPAARPWGRSPHPLPARAPQGPPRRSQPALPARGSRGRPGASNGLRGPGSGEWSPAALMCGRPARRQLLPPRRPRAPIDTHQAAGGRGRPLPPGASARSFRGLPRWGWRRATRGGGAPPGGRPGLLSAARRSPLTLSNLSIPAPVLVPRPHPLPRRALSFPARSLRLSLSGSWGGPVSRPRWEAVAFVRSLGPVALRPPALTPPPLCRPSCRSEPGSPRWLLWGQSQGQGDQDGANEALGGKTGGAPPQKSPSEIKIKITL